MTLTRGEESDARMALRLWGKDAQMVVCIEELAELASALAKEMRPSRRSNPDIHAQDIDHIAEEIADVKIIMNQIQCIFDIEQGDDDDFHALVAIKKEEKLSRLRDRIDKAERRRSLFPPPSSPLALASTSDLVDELSGRACVAVNAVDREDKYHLEINRPDGPSESRRWNGPVVILQVVNHIRTKNERGEYVYRKREDSGVC